MRALLAANVYISFLLTRHQTPPRLVVEAALDGAYELLITSGVIDEVRHKTTTKPYLADRITEEEVIRFVEGLIVIGEALPEFKEPLPAVGRDRKDDYLFAHAVLGQADYLVSGDRGVRAVDQIGAVQIVSPSEFLIVLEEAR